jgi:acyl-CoA hydrolase/acetoin utilization deacetylase AcuC-like enzyme
MPQLTDPLTWRQRYAHKLHTASAALERVRSGQTVYIGSGAAEPTVLTEAMLARVEALRDVVVIHLLGLGESPFADPALAVNVRLNTFFVGRGMEEAVRQGRADYTPMSVTELPRAIAQGIIPVDVALVQVSPPDAMGSCSLGIAVDAGLAAVEHAALVIAQVNDRMPVAHGDARVHVDQLHALVEGSVPLIEVPGEETDPISVTIGRLVADIIRDGAVLHFGRSAVSSATMRFLEQRKDLGIHTDVLTSDLLRLIHAGAVTNRTKGVHRGRTVATTAHGDLELYRALHQNPAIELHPVDHVNDPFVIAQNPGAVAVLEVEEVDLSGKARIHGTVASSKRGSLGAALDYIEGVSRAEGGLVVLALPSVDPETGASRIVAEGTGRGVYLPRSKIDIVVTEYGSVHLRGLSLRERAVALISVAHPRHRHALMVDAKAACIVAQDQGEQPEHGSVYPHHYETTRTFRGDLEVFFRPVKPSDVRRIQQLFHSLDPETVRMRWHASLNSLSRATLMSMTNIDYSKDMAIVGLVGPRGNRRIICEGRCLYNPVNRMGEFDILVHDDFQGHGLGKFLANYLIHVAYARGLHGLYAEVLQDNMPMRHMLDRAWPTARVRHDAGLRTYEVHFSPADRGRPKDAILIHSPRFADFSLGEDHPFRPGRARALYELLKKQGWLSEPWMRVEMPEPLPPGALAGSVDPAFWAAIQRASRGEIDRSLVGFGLGTDECPVFPGLDEYVLLYCGATMTAVRLINEQNANLVFNPLGGMHHSGRGHAEGFCYVNDAILAIDALLAAGHRVAYIDIDAHHGNGVQDSYWRDDRVLTVSIHESGATLYPWKGFEHETGGGPGEGYTLNVPLPAGSDDEVFRKAFDAIIYDRVKAFEPTVCVVVAGADMHRSDPLSHLQLTNNAMAHAMEHIRGFAPHLLMLGGGGYNPDATVRAWARMWASANRIDALPDYLSMVGGTFLGDSDLDGSDVVDMPWRVTGKEKQAMLAEVERLATALR